MERPIPAPPARIYSRKKFLFSWFRREYEQISRFQIAGCAAASKPGCARETEIILHNQRRKASADRRCPVLKDHARDMVQAISGRFVSIFRGRCPRLYRRVTHDLIPTALQCLEPEKQHDDQSPSFFGGIRSRHIACRIVRVPGGTCLCGILQLCSRSRRLRRRQQHGIVKFWQAVRRHPEVFGRRQRFRSGARQRR